jgi:hypothetical protein
MPYEITKFDNTHPEKQPTSQTIYKREANQPPAQASYKVTSPNGVKAKSTTKSKAKKQVRLLNAIDHGFEPGMSPYRASNNKFAK